MRLAAVQGILNINLNLNTSCTCLGAQVSTLSIMTDLQLCTPHWPDAS